MFQRKLRSETPVGASAASAARTLELRKVSRLCAFQQLWPHSITPLMFTAFPNSEILYLSCYEEARVA